MPPPRLRSRRLPGPADPPRRPRVRRRAARLQRDDRPASGADRPLRRRRRRRAGDRVRPRARAAARRPRRRPQRRRPGHLRRRRRRRPVAACDDIAGRPADRAPRASAAARTLGEVDRATHEHGLALPTGIIATTGVGGITLGGGIGLPDALAAGWRSTTCSPPRSCWRPASGCARAPTSTRDLFWAMRGGGGNFGVVTSFEFRLHPVDTVVAGPTFWPVELGAEVLSAYREFLPARAARAVRLLRLRDACRPRTRSRASCTCARSAASSGTTAATPSGAARDDGAVARRAARRRCCTASQPMPHPAMQSTFDGLYPTGDQWYWRADFVRELPDAAVARHAQLRRDAADHEVDHAPVPDRRRRARRRRRRHGLELPRRDVGHGDRRRRSRPGQRRRHPRLVASTTTTRCTRTRPAAPT